MLRLPSPAAVVWIALGYFCAPKLHAGEAAQFSAEDLMRVERLSDPQVSPDGRYVVFSVRQTDIDANKSRTALWLLDLKEGKSEPRRLTSGETNDTNGRWAPDSRSLYFLSTRSGSSQVWHLSAATGEARQVTRLPLDVSTLKVAPTGNRLLVSLEVFPDCPDLDCTARQLEAAAKSPSKAQIYNRLFIRHWDIWDDGRQSHLFSLAVSADGSAAGPPVDLTRRLDADVPSKPRGGDEEFNFSPDGTRVAFTARIKGKDEAWSTNFDVFETAADGSGEPHNLTIQNPAWDAEPTYSPDGRWLAWKAMDRPQNEADRFHLVLADRKGGSRTVLAGHWDHSISAFAFSTDSRHIYATADHLGQHPLWSIDLPSGKQTIIHAQGQVTDLSVGGHTIVYGLAALDAPVDLYSADAKTGRTQRLTHFNSELLGKRRLGEFEQFSFQGWHGEQVSGYIMLPFGFNAGHKYPIAFIVHGGPQVSYANGWSYRWNPQVYAGWGYAVVFIDFHGSTGYGQAFTDSITGDWGGKPLEDLRLGLAAAIAHYPWLDGARACALGASYSGYMMNWIEGNWPDRFRCIVNLAGIFDVRGMYYETDEIWLDEFEQGGPQFANPASYEKHNPILHVAKWRTPMLLGHGLIDFNVPYSQGVSAFTALQRRGIESRLVIFPNEGHFILKPQDSLLWHREVHAWLDKWLKPGAAN
jgi:dipeptidyl aminopeptidase/acylaminoacyl peptidase